MRFITLHNWTHWSGMIPQGLCILLVLWIMFVNWFPTASIVSYGVIYVVCVLYILLIISCKCNTPCVVRSLPHRLMALWTPVTLTVSQMTKRTLHLMRSLAGMWNSEWTEAGCVMAETALRHSDSLSLNNTLTTHASAFAHSNVKICVSERQGCLVMECWIQLPFSMVTLILWTVLKEQSCGWVEGTNVSMCCFRWNVCDSWCRILFNSVVHISARQVHRSCFAYNFLFGFRTL